MPWYTLHKLFAGLLDAQCYTGNAHARQAVIKLADWVCDLTDAMTDEQIQAMLVAEHGGMSEALANVCQLTGNPKYLALAKRFTHRSVIDPLAQGRDELDGLHANTQVPKLIAAARIFELSGDDDYRKAARTFWQAVVRRRTFAQGGNSDHEHFFPPADTRLSLTTASAETCNVHNMLRLSKQLFSLTPDREIADFHERALFNQILGGIDPRRGMFTYYQSLRPGGFKVYSDPHDAMWCCVGTGMENPARFGEAIYFAQGRTLWVNLFIASELRWVEQGVTIRQVTTFPTQPATTLSVHMERPTPLQLRLRVPGWMDQAPTMHVNDLPVPLSIENGYAVVQCTWQDGDQLKWTLPMKVRAEQLEHAPDIIAFVYGPVALAGQLGVEGLDGIDWYLTQHQQNKYARFPAPTPPALIGKPEELAEAVQPTEAPPGSVAFKLQAADGQWITLLPFAQTHFVRYTVYWQTFADRPTCAAEHQRTVSAAAFEQELDARTVDRVRVGEQKPEIDHQFLGNNSRTGSLGSIGRWRDASEGGFFQYQLAVDPEADLDLQVTYYGGETGARTFDILIDADVLVTVSLQPEKPGKSYVRTYPLSPQRARGKTHMVVRFQPHPGNIAGGVFDLRVARRV